MSPFYRSGARGILGVSFSKFLLESKETHQSGAIFEHLIETIAAVCKKFTNSLPMLYTTVVFWQRVKSILRPS